MKKLKHDKPYCGLRIRTPGSCRFPQSWKTWKWQRSLKLWFADLEKSRTGLEKIREIHWWKCGSFDSCLVRSVIMISRKIHPEIMNGLSNHRMTFILLWNTKADQKDVCSSVLISMWMCKNVIYYAFSIFQDSLMNRKLKRTAFIWNRKLLKHYKCIYCNFETI